MAAITWRNVDGPSLGEASGILSEAGKSLNAGLGVFDKMLQQREAVQAKNWEATKSNNTQAYMDALAAAKTPEELAALEKSGALTQMVDGFGGQVDKDKIRGAVASQLNTLRTQEGVTNQYNDAALARKEAPINDEITMRIAQKDFTGAKALLLEKNLKNEGVQWNAMNAAERQQYDQKINDELKGYQVTIARNQAADTLLARNNAAEDRALQADALNYSSIVGKQQQDLGMTLGKIATAKGYPVDASGMVDRALLTPEQRAELKIEARKIGVDSESFGVGDTKSFTNYIDSVRGSGKYSSEAIARNVDAIQGRFNTSKIGASIGNDAANTALADAKRKVLDDEQRGSNWHAPGSSNAMNTYEIVAKEIPQLMDKTTGFGDVEDDVGPLQDFVHKMATVGIDVGGGNMITPSVNDLRAVIRSAQGGWFKDKTRADNAEAALIEIMQKSGSLDKIAEAEAIKVRDRTRSAKDILNGVRAAK